MKCSDCLLCGKPSMDEEPPCDGDWLTFTEYEAHDEFSLTHPIGLEYFCDEHITAAKALTHMRTEQAMAELHQQFGYPEYKYPPIKLSWWNRFLLWIGYC